MGENNADAILAQLDISGIEAQFLAQALLDRGALQITDDGFRLTIGACAEGVVVGPQPPALTALLAAIRDNGCTLSNADLGALVEVIDPGNDVAAHIADLLELELLVALPDLKTLVLSDAMCTTPDDSLPVLVGQVQTLLETPRLSRPRFLPSERGLAQAVVDAIILEGCEWATNDVYRVLGFYEYQTVLLPMEEENLLTLGDEVATVADALCAAVPEVRRAMVADAMGQ